MLASANIGALVGAAAGAIDSVHFWLLRYVLYHCHSIRATHFLLQTTIVLPTNRRASDTKTMLPGVVDERNETMHYDVFMDRLLC